jgi:hypothetical protein
MIRVTLLRRYALIAGLAMTALPMNGRANAQQSGETPQNNKAPFGLTWGMDAGSVNDIENSGVTDYLNTCDDKDIRDNGISCVASRQGARLPGAPDDANEIDMFFGFSDKLYDIHAEGVTDSADSVMTRYQELSSLLFDLYGPGQETVAPTKWFGSEPINTVLRSTLFNTPTVQVTLSLREGELYSGKDAAYWTLDYLNLAGFAAYQTDALNHKKNGL